MFLGMKRFVRRNFRALIGLSVGLSLIVLMGFGISRLGSRSVPELSSSPALVEKVDAPVAKRGQSIFSAKKQDGPKAFSKRIRKNVICVDAKTLKTLRNKKLARSTR